MYDTVTVLGRVANDPVRNVLASGVAVTNFRLASSQRRYDAKTGEWVDAGTNWYSVSAFRRLGEHAKSSLRCGDPVIVTGRVKIRDWESNGRKGTSVDIDAESIGHDLRWGTSAYARAERIVVAGAVTGDGPDDASHHRDAADGEPHDALVEDTTHADAWAVSSVG